MMKKIFFLSLLMSFSVQISQAKTLVISDVDDTIKMTNVLGSNTEIVFNGLVRSKAFAGMSELYRSMEKQGTTFFYVSGSPKIIRSRVHEFLEDNKFPQNNNIILKKNISSDTLEFKVKSIRGLIASEKPSELILIGDDTEHDPEVYKIIAREFPKLVKATYIRSVQNAKVEATTFFSAVEIAIYEINEERLAETTLSFITNGFVRQTNRSGVALEDHYCPKEGRLEIEELKQKATTQYVFESLEKAQAKIIRTCN